MTNVLFGKWALVTGASSGLGADFARDLAGRGCNLILVARREALLSKLEQEIKSKNNVQIEVIPVVLAARDTPQALYDQIKASGKAVDVLINNAGYGIFGEFVEIPWERERDMLELDIITLVQMTKLFVKDMVARNFGYVLQIASIGAYQPSPTYATYSAAKSFVLFFSEALSYELRKTKVRVTVLSPGVTQTEFLQVAGQQPTLYQRLARMKSPDVTRIGINAMLRGRPSLVPGLLNALMVWFNRLTPRRWSAVIADRLMRIG